MRHYRSNETHDLQYHSASWRLWRTGDVTPSESEELRTKGATGVVSVYRPTGLRPGKASVATGVQRQKSQHPSLKAVRQEKVSFSVEGQPFFFYSGLQPIG